MSKLDIAFVSPEVVPFAKTGGLADVAGALPDALCRRGHAVSVFMPLYAAVDKNRFGIASVKTSLDCGLPGRTENFNLHHCRLPGSDCDYYFIRNDAYFARNGLYVSPETGKDWENNHLRFAFFARAVLRSLAALNSKPDLIHCNDWQSGLIPAYLKNGLEPSSFFESTKTILTIHNIGYQGLFPAESFAELGFDQKLFYATGPFEFYGKLNFLKAGIEYADVLTTVSPRYAEEIQQSEEYGCGLEGVLKRRAADLFGILNGADYSIWNPATDSLIAANYDSNKLAAKAKNKLALKRLVKLPLVRRDVPLIGMISRLASQKGFDLIAETKEELFKLDIQMVILGTGDPVYENLLQELSRKHPKKLAVVLKFDDKLAHLIEAGSDIFLMPSRYEPCGLNQIYSLRYGTVPIVRETGGLADTIENLNPVRNTGTGFVFKNYSSREMLKAVKFAIEVYKNKPLWSDLMRRGMSKDFSWDFSAEKYEEVYRAALQRSR